MFEMNDVLFADHQEGVKIDNQLILEMPLFKGRVV
jgi:hypothetical protein